MFATPNVQVAQIGETVSVRSGHALGAFARCSGEYLEHWARVAPSRPFLMERSTTQVWRGVTYAEALEQVEHVGTWLLEQNLSRERPVAILSENSVEHGVLTLAGLHVGVPVAPISPAYSLVSKDFAKLKAIVRTLSPGLVYAGDSRRFAGALGAIRDLHTGSVVVSGERELPDGAISFDELSARRDRAAVERAFAAITPDTLAKILFTSGSLGEPKGVLNPQRMLCSNQQAIAQIWPFITDTPVLVDWLPWHHTFGGNHNFNIVLRNGGTLYIDQGRPVPGCFDATLSNLREIGPTACLNVPRAYDMLATALRSDAGLCERFFARLQVLFYAGAALPQHLWEAFRDLALRTRGEAIPLISSWGLTETAPAATTCHFRSDRAGVVGLPLPACELKLVPNGNKLEARVRGPNVTPGYWKRPDLNASAFDEDGFFITGDALRFVDPQRPERGLLFDGRVAEDFKLSTATWVNVGALRLEAITALAPIAQDVVIAGHDRDELGFLIFPNLAACRKLCVELSSDATAAEVLAHPAVRAHVRAGLHALQQNGGGSSTCARRALLLIEPPSIDAGEITDKGYTNQATVLSRRAELVEALYRVPLDRAVIEPGEPLQRAR
jgi:feruloyl-CoA synthase